MVREIGYMKIFMSAELGIDDKDYNKFSEIQNMIEKKIKELIAGKNYGDAVKEIGIIPTIMSPKFAGFLAKERKLFSWKTKTADIRLKIDYKKFKKADEEGKQKLIIKNIIDSIRILKTKVKKGFDGDKLEADILKLFNINY